MTIEYSRISQQQRQRAAIDARSQKGMATITTYSDRDPVTGYRNVIAADGGTLLANSISNSQFSGVVPITYDLSIPGIPNVISQAPSA